MHDALGDVVHRWSTLKEPWVASHLGYGSGGHAPGIADGAASLAASHHLLLGHGLATEVLRAGRHRDTQVGITLNLTVAVPGGDDPADAAAAWRTDGDSNRYFLDPVLLGRYPPDLVEWFGPDAYGFVRDGDLAHMAVPLDFLGVNYYMRAHVRAAGPNAGRSLLPSLGVASVVPAGLPTTAMGWPVEPDGLRQLLVRLRKDYPSLPPVYITENGAAIDDVAADGTVDDPDRIAYLDGHLRAVHQAISEGVDVCGYCVWSLLDNFEWAEGYDKRFGIVYVDYDTQERIPKSSARWYAGVAGANGLPELPDRG